MYDLSLRLHNGPLQLTTDGLRANPRDSAGYSGNGSKPHREAYGLGDIVQMIDDRELQTKINLAENRAVTSY